MSAKTSRRVLVALLATVLVTGTVDALTRAAMHGQVVPRFVASGTTRRKLVVLYHGLMGHAETQFGAVQDWYLKNGFDVLQIVTLGSKYDPELVAMTAATAIQEIAAPGHYDHIVFDGASLGARAAVDTKLELRKRSFVFGAKTALFAEGAPMTWRSIAGPNKYGAWVLSRVPFGAVSNRLLGPLFGRVMVTPPREENIEPGADRAFLDQSVEAARETKVSMYSSQLGSFAGRDAYSDRSLRGLFDEVDFFWFDKDHMETVDQPTALLAWRRAFGAQPVGVVRVGSTHVDFAAAPGANITAHEEICRELGVIA